MESEIPKRLSEAYPPGSVKNCEFLAEVHKDINEIRVESFDPKRLTYRPIKSKTEMEQIRLLHKEWFPIDYSPEFFDMVSSGRTKSLVVEIKVQRNNRTSQSIVIGCILYSIRRANNKHMQYSLSDYFSQKKSIYILTIGVVNEFRKMGVATSLLLEVMRMHEADTSIKYIYLHVISYNKTAQNFYKKNAFHLIRTKTNHYCIEGTNYDAFVFVRYLNGGTKPMSILEVFKYIFTICNLTTYLLAKVKGVCKRSREKQPYKSLK